jgi:hypothetical protein
MRLTRSTSCCCLNMERVLLIAVAVVVTGPVTGLVLPVQLPEPLILPTNPLQARIIEESERRPFYRREKLCISRRGM